MSKLDPYFGEYGGQFVPQILVPALDQLEDAFIEAQEDPAFKKEFMELLTEYAGRPTALTLCQNLTKGTKTKLYLKREDLLHGGAHKTNQVLGQALLAKRMGKNEIIAETGAGQHGVATALACALLDLKCRVYMGAKDVERQSPNVFRMRLMGAEVIPVHSGSATLKDACNEALRDWTGSYDRAHYLLGTAPGLTRSRPLCVNSSELSAKKPNARSRKKKAACRMPLSPVSAADQTLLACSLTLLMTPMLALSALSQPGWVSTQLNTAHHSSTVKPVFSSG